ncbi:MAG: SufE family protein [Marinilabiliales bacterium]|nr:MAG: SufE family protein [Marinilabiliales bacterium]
MDIEKVQEEIVDEFGLFDDWMDKYNYLIELSKSLPVIDEKHKKPEYLIEGCQSRVWLHAGMDDGKVVYTADSDAVITKGIIALLIRVLSDRKPDEIIDNDLWFIDRIGLKENLSPTRSNGLVSMIKQMKLYALAYKVKSEKPNDDGKTG